MNWYKIITSYDGTDHYGWQIQKNLPTIALIMQNSFRSVFNSSIILRGASRTDAGVHAFGHVAFFSTALNCDVCSMQLAWNNALPDAIRIKEIVRVDSLVHPHAQVATKTYWYHIATEMPSPFFARYAWHVQKKIDFDRLKQALSLFVGTYDFKLFCSSDVLCSTIRTIEAIDFAYIKEQSVWRVTVRGKSFLRYMIRRIIGAAVDVATNQDLSLTYIQEMLEYKRQHKALFCAPAKGLVLHSITYRDTQ